MPLDTLYLADNGDGTYRNPVLFCDYSDPDVIRVGGTYYMTASSFNYTPGLPILTSQDLVNWRLASYALETVPDGYDGAPRHAQGVWAPAIRWHEGRFYIYFGMPDEGIYMVRTADPLGPWEKPVLVLSGKGLIDPCPFWDDDGRAWIVHAYAKSRIGFKSRLGIFPMSQDGTRAIGDDHLLFDGTREHPTIEGPKLYKREGWYFIFAPAGGVPGGWQVVLRSRNLMGPYEPRVVLKQGSGPVNGPHQGAWVTTPSGEDWFLHFQSRGLYGRIIHLQPMSWGDDGWPRMGMDDPAPLPPAAVTGADDPVAKARAADCGIPVAQWRKPAGPACPPLSEQASDDFAGPLGLQWQFVGNQRPDFFQVTSGRLRLFARQLPDGGTTLWQCPQALTQKLCCPAFFATVQVDVRGLRPGEQAGLALLGGQYAYAALRRDACGVSLAYVVSEGDEHREKCLETRALDAQQLTLRLTLLPTGYAEAAASFEYSLDGERFRPVGQPFLPARHTWVGARMALFAMPLDGRTDQCGYADFRTFRVNAVDTLV